MARRAAGYFTQTLRHALLHCRHVVCNSRVTLVKTHTDEAALEYRTVIPSNNNDNNHNTTTSNSNNNTGAVLM